MGKIIIVIYVAYLLIMSLITIILFTKDKKMAQQNGNMVRIKEKNLLACCAFGGAIGAFLGRIICHHKTKKLYFSFTIYVSIIFQIGVLGALIWLAL